MSASENGTKGAITSSQVRAARALLDWSRDELSELSRVPKRTIARLESGEGMAQRRTIKAICSTLEGAGVEFIAENGGGPGVRLRGRSRKA